MVANFSVFYSEVRQGEILLLQDHISTTGKLNNLSTVMQAVTPIQGWLVFIHLQIFNHNASSGVSKRQSLFKGHCSLDYVGNGIMEWKTFSNQFEYLYNRNLPLCSEFLSDALEKILSRNLQSVPQITTILSYFSALHMP